MKFLNTEKSSFSGPVAGKHPQTAGWHWIGVLDWEESP